MALGSVISLISQGSQSGGYVGDVVNTGLGRNIGNTSVDGTGKRIISNILDIGGNFTGLFNAFSKNKSDGDNVTNQQRDLAHNQALSVSNQNAFDKARNYDLIGEEKKLSILAPISTFTDEIIKNVPTTSKEYSEILKQAFDVFSFVKAQPTTTPTTKELSEGTDTVTFKNNFTTELNEKVNGLFSNATAAANKYGELKESELAAENAKINEFFDSQIALSNAAQSEQSVQFIPSPVQRSNISTSLPIIAIGGIILFLIIKRRK